MGEKFLHEYLRGTDEVQKILSSLLANLQTILANV